MDKLYQKLAVQVLLKGHLCIGEALSYLIAAGVPRKGVLDLENMSFISKLRMAYALGLVDQDEKVFIAAFHNLRNKVAHEDPIVTRERALLLYDLLRPSIKRYADAVVEPSLDDIVLRIQLAVVLTCASLTARAEPFLRP